MNYYYITGTSRGIGKALATVLLEESSNKVIGISRQCTIDHPNYQHLSLDLSDTNVLASFKFGKHSDAEKIVLINNAGTLASVKSVGNQDASVIIQGYTLNLIAPSVLTNLFINCYESETVEKIILNISSGAGKNPIDGWSVYCATKAGLDMYSLVVDAEQSLKGSSKKIKIFSIAPGVVDTAMQDEIRTAEKSDFSKVDNFICLKENNQLSSTVEVAKKYLKLLNSTGNINGVLDSLRDHS